PEEADTFEGGIRFENDLIFASLTLYRQTIDDVIYAVGGVRDNGGELETTGYETTVGFHQNGWLGSLTVSEADPELNGETLSDNEIGLGTAYGRLWTAQLAYTVAPIDLDIGWLSQ